MLGEPLGPVHISEGVVDECEGDEAEVQGLYLQIYPTSGTPARM